MAGERFFLELPTPPEVQRSWPHVVIVGAGFAGLKLCHALIGKPVRVTLIDKRNFNLFQPLLYQVATGLVSETDIATPLRQMVGHADNVQVLLGEVEDLDPVARQIVFHDQTYSYDHLVIATGSGSSYFGHEEWRSLAPPMKILEHAAEIRRRLLMALEEAEQCQDPVRKQALQTVVVVGAGPTGCELAGALNQLIRRSIRTDFKQLRAEDCRIVLVDAVARVLPAMPEELSAAAHSYLEQAGVELQLNSMVEQIGPGRVQLRQRGAEATGTADAALEIAAATICWTAGVRPSRLAKRLAERTGCAVDRGGRVMVEKDFSIAGHPEIRVLGDLCAYAHTPDGKPLPGMAGPAVQMGGWVAQDLLAGLEGGRASDFRWMDLGSMAVIGPWYAVADLRGLHVSGLLGWVLWALAHLAFIPDTENRLALFVKWMWQIATRRRTDLLIVGPPDQHLGVDVGLNRAELESPPFAPAEARGDS